MGQDTKIVQGDILSGISSKPASAMIAVAMSGVEAAKSFVRCRVNVGLRFGRKWGKCVERISENPARVRLTWL